MQRFNRFFVVLLSATALTAAAQAANYTETAVTNGGSVSGRITLGEAEPEAQSFTISKNPEVCGTGTREVAWVRGNGDALLDAVVYLEEVDAGKPFPDAATEIMMDQQGCRYDPYIQVMANGGNLNVINSDGVLHNIHTYELIGRARRTVFNVSQPEAGDAFTKEVSLRRGVAMKVECDAHDFMHAWVFVAKNPYYALVGENGEFSIADIPPGTYAVKSWHGTLGEQEMTIEVTAGGEAEANFSY